MDQFSKRHASAPLRDFPDSDRRIARRRRIEAKQVSSDKVSSSIEESAPGRDIHATTAFAVASPWHTGCSLAHDAGNAEVIDRSRRTPRPGLCDVSTDPAVREAVLAACRWCRPLHGRGGSAQPCLSLVREAGRRRSASQPGPSSALVVLRRHDCRAPPRRIRSRRAEVCRRDDRSGCHARSADRALPALPRDAVRVLHETAIRPGGQPRAQRRAGRRQRGERHAGRRRAERGDPARGDGVHGRPRVAARARGRRDDAAADHAHAACRAGAQGDQAPRAGAHERAHGRGHRDLVDFRGAAREDVRQRRNRGDAIPPARRGAEAPRACSSAGRPVVPDAAAGVRVDRPGDCLRSRRMADRPRADPAGNRGRARDAHEACLQPGERSRRRARGSDDELRLLRARVRRPRPDRAAAQEAPAMLGRAAGRLEFRNVSFAYDDESAAALSAVDVTIPEGTTVGIVGSSGAGKTTLGALIMRLYDPTDGAVFLDGTDLRAGVPVVVARQHRRRDAGDVSPPCHGAREPALRKSLGLAGTDRGRRPARADPRSHRRPAGRRTTPWSENAATVSPPGSGNGSPSPGRS